MTIVFQSFLILSNILYYSSYSFSNEIVLQDVKIDLLSVIKELGAFIDILLSEKQTYNGDVSLNITQLGIKYGYPLQDHQVETEDGYVLTMFRIKKEGPPVFLMHGLLLSADDWLTAGPEDSLVYLLATAGYDVWMGNARGNKYSRQHVATSPENATFWEFSWDEIGRFDLPAMINYILDTTNKTQLSYIGHSQGTTAFFVMCSERPSYNEKISNMIALAPLAWISHIKSPLVRATSPFHYYGGIIASVFNTFEIFPKPLDFEYLQTPLCEIGHGIICITLLFIFGGFDYEQINKKNLPVIFGHSPSGASYKQFQHYLQNIDSESFSKFDYGEDKNYELYKTSKPPKYVVENIKVPVGLIYSENDWLCDVKDVEILKNTLPNVIDFYRVPFNKFNHIDYLWAKDVKHLVYAKVLELIKTM